ncbi:DNA-binding MarR family transcriptional regulator [Anaerosolibacter carboniphilus]|uniref:DNA-binding MarR family transcriptional regulator n=1 Tax=Anaerosolibacter carboniphilus TaxID=1417629 RepID=A0A841KKL1_9FIRM|nr:MarR family transcriptional regulator [Anaerosolibacter carboniphilus]MBB6214404.1 DNA-binding MarR family transcriptional regulator [Anaerosolibacter carboniphilus]
MEEIKTNIPEQLQYLLKKIHMNMRHAMMKEMDSSHLTMHQVFIMKMIKKHPETNLTTLCNHLSLAKSSLSLTVNRLVDEGYLQRIENKEDRRNIYFVLSDLGEKVFNEMREKNRELFSELVDGLSPEELVEIEAQLLKLNETIEKNMKD